MLNLVLALIGIFALIVIVGRLLHRYFIYLPNRSRVAPKDAGLLSVEEVVFKAADGTKLIAWYQPARGPKPTLLYFTGNSGNVANRANKIRTIAADGYGVFSIGRRTLRPHRFFFESVYGPIAKAMQIDHAQCANPPCVRPDHLEVVTLRENVLRGVGTSARNATKTHCKWGHEFTDANTGHRPKGRYCKACYRRDSANRRARMKAS